jgi:anti-sigma factor RsiW
MPQNSYPAAERREQHAPSAQPRWLRREPGLATVLLGLGVMVLALLLPQEQRTLAFYPAIALLVIGTFLTLRHGPDRHRDFQSPNDADPR